MIYRRTRCLQTPHTHTHTHTHTHNTVAFENSLHKQGRNAIMKGHLLAQNIILSVSAHVQNVKQSAEL